MQATFASLQAPSQAASAQVMRGVNDLDQTSEQSHVNPFSIASRKSDLPPDQQVTAEGFFKNPSKAVQQKDTISER